MLAVGVGLTDLPVLGGGSNRPTFAVNFANGESAVSKYGFTFTRSGAVATYVDSAGLIATATADVPRYTYDPVTLAPLGILIEESAVNYATYSNDFTNAAWVKSNITAALTQTGPDGVANSASLLTATAGNGTALQTLTRSSAARISSVYIKRVTGSGTVNVTQDNGSTWTAVTVTAAWTRVSIASATAANPIIGVRLVTSGDEVAVWGFQHEEKAFITSVIPTTSAAVTRGADTYSFTGAAGRTNLIVGSAAPATQNVTTTATAYTLSHTGTGTITLSGTSTAGPLVGAGSLTFTPSAGTLTLTMSGTVTNAQLETGSSATAYIATTNGPRTVENVASWFNGDNFTVVVFAVPGVPNGTTKLCGVIGDSAYTGSSRLYVRLDGGTGNVSITSGTLTSTGSLGSVTNSSAHKFAYTYSMSAAQTAGCMDGGSVATANQTTTLYKETSMAPGGHAGVNYLNGTLAYIAYYPTRLSNATLQALTT